MKKLTKNINSQFNPTLFNYKNGGFLGRNIGNLAQIAGGTILTATGLGAPMGIGMIASGAGGMATTEVANKQQQQQAQQQQKQAIQQQMINNLPGQPQYVPTFARGGKLYHNKPNVARLSALELRNGGKVNNYGFPPDIEFGVLHPNATFNSSRFNLAKKGDVS